MSDNVSDNKRIVKNTLFLYVRMFITMAVGLFTSRVVLRTLGIDGYGIYNIVGGIVVLFSFISNALRNATQRYLSYEIGKKEAGDVQRVFNMTIQCHIVIGLFLFIIAETVGLWFATTQLNIPAGRESAVAYVYQFSVLTFIIQILQVPFNSSIISSEKMSFYAYISIFETLLKLGLVYMLVILPCDKLVLYSVLMALVSLIVLLIYIFYVFFSIGLRRFYYVRDYGLFKGIMGFSSMSMLNGCANLFAQQGSNIFINIFNGVAANAAFGIASQVSSIIYGFVSNFQSAFQPQIVKQYAAKQYESLKRLIFRTSSLSYYLLLIITIPFAFEANYVLKLWLGIVPENASIFCIMLLCYFLLDAIQAPIWMLTYGTGNIKQYTVVTGLLTILNLPISWRLLYLHYPLYSVFVVRIILNFLCCIYRMIYVHKYIDFPSVEYFVKVCMRALLVTTVSIVIILIIKQFNMYPMLSILIYALVTIGCVFTYGFNKDDRNAVLLLITSKIKRQ